MGFTGSDNQGIIGLEVEYDSYLSGINGKILTLATAHGIETDNAAERPPALWQRILRSSTFLYPGQKNRSVKETTFSSSAAAAVTTLNVDPGSWIEIDNAAENRVEPIPGNSLYTSLDVTMQMYAEQAAKKVMDFPICA